MRARSLGAAPSQMRVSTRSSVRPARAREARSPRRGGEVEAAEPEPSSARASAPPSSASKSCPLDRRALMDMAAEHELRAGRGSARVGVAMLQRKLARGAPRRRGEVVVTDHDPQSARRGIGSAAAAAGDRGRAGRPGDATGARIEAAGDRVLAAARRARRPEHVPRTSHGRVKRASEVYGISWFPGTASSAPKLARARLARSRLGHARRESRGRRWRRELRTRARRQTAPRVASSAQRLVAPQMAGRRCESDARSTAERGYTLAPCPNSRPRSSTTSTWASRPAAPCGSSGAGRS